MPAPACAYELLIFPRLEVEHTEAHANQPESTEWTAAASIFYTGDWKQLRALVEFSLEYERSQTAIEREKEFERAQLGWSFDSNNTLWVGRYHTPIGYWNTAHHHGAHLQTSISRPRVHEFEDEGGILPVHFFGLLLSGMQSSRDNTFTYDIGAASGPTLTDNGLEPVEVLAPQHFGKPSFVARTAWRPDVVLESEFGAFAAHSRIPVTSAPADEIGQTIAGAYANLDLSPWRILGEVFWVRNVFRSTGDSPTFTSGVLEAEYRLGHQWVLYARQELTGSSFRDPYLDRFIDFPKARTVAGVRFDITHHQATTLELASHERRDGVKYLQYAVQWSTVLP
jgi:hypothetical protein